MKLFYSPNSPYARKCRVLALEKGIDLDLVEVNVADEPAELLAVNPLGKIPALVIDDGKALCDSPVICEYLDTQGESTLIPMDPKARLECLNLTALADGIMDASVAVVLESRRPAEKQWDGWVKRQYGKIERSIALAARQNLDEITLGTLALAVALSYVQFRQPDVQWLEKYPELAKWLEAINARESMKKTAPVA